MLSSDFQSLEELRPFASKCPRCSLCKFPPLVRVESARYSGICPSYEELKVHASSGGGMLVLAMSLLDGRSEPTGAVRRIAFGCHACGGCDVACKFSADIEVQETILQLRAKLFAERGPLPGHDAVLASLARRGHPLPEHDTDLAAGLVSLGLRPRAGASVLLWLGPHYALDARREATLRRALSILDRAGVAWTTLGEREPYTGRAALEIGDRATFRGFAERAARAIEGSGAARIVCLSAEDYATLRADVPRVARVSARVSHLVELYDELLARRRLRPRGRIAKIATWHDTSYLGRLSEPFIAWRGVARKVEGQIEIYDPPRPVRSGGGGCYEPPRRVLARIPELVLCEMPRRREYAFDSGESGQTRSALPDLALATARRRAEEARSTGAGLLVTECPQSLSLLEQACAAGGPGLAATSLTDLLATSLEGDLS